MSERQKQTVFLKRLLQNEESEQQQELQQRIAQAERDERCVRTAMHLVAVIGLLSISGICYEAVFVEDFFQNPTHLLTRVLAYLGLGSLISWVMFLGYYLWHRALTNRYCEECRRLLMTAQQHAVVQMEPSSCSETTQWVVSKEDTPPDLQSDPLRKAA